MNKQIVNSVASLFLYLLLLVFAPLSFADWKMPPDPPLEVGLEMDIVSVLIGTNHKGVLTGRVCSECKLLQVRITPRTLYYINPDQRSDLLRARDLRGKGAVVVYKLDSLEAIKLIKLPDADSKDD